MNICAKHSVLPHSFNDATVIGLGVTGYSCVRYLQQQGLRVRVVDENIPSLAEKLYEQFPDVPAVFGSFSAQDIDPQSLIVISPSVSLQHPSLVAVQEVGTVIVGDVEIFLQQIDEPVIAITGSNGKSTVTSLVGELCRNSGLNPLVAGNIGVPVLDALTDGRSFDLVVLELSSYQLESISSLKPMSACILNICEDHCQRYASMHEYVNAKMNITRNAEIVVLPAIDDYISYSGVKGKSTVFFADQPPDQHISYGVCSVHGEAYLMHGSEPLLPVRSIPLTGAHNRHNVLAALALVEPLAIAPDIIEETVRNFCGLPHRLQVVAQHQNVVWINDSKATNMGATIAALKSVTGSVFWIGGGDGKGADFSQLLPALCERVQLAVLFGRDAHEIAAVLEYSSLEVEVVEDLVAAVQTLRDRISSHPSTQITVLFSPACASLDMYQDYQQRGDHFVRLIQQEVLGES